MAATTGLWYRVLDAWRAARIVTGGPVPERVLRWLETTQAPRAASGRRARMALAGWRSVRLMHGCTSPTLGRFEDGDGRGPGAGAGSQSAHQADFTRGGGRAGEGACYRSIHGASTPGGRARPEARTTWAQRTSPSPSSQRCGDESGPNARAGTLCVPAPRERTKHTRAAVGHKAGNSLSSEAVDLEGTRVSMHPRHGAGGKIHPKRRPPLGAGRERKKQEESAEKKGKADGEYQRGRPMQEVHEEGDGR